LGLGLGVGFGVGFGVGVALTVRPPVAEEARSRRGSHA
jgi:hypothetical protein